MTPAKLSPLSVAMQDMRDSGMEPISEKQLFSKKQPVTFVNSLTFLSADSKVKRETNPHEKFVRSAHENY